MDCLDVARVDFRLDANDGNKPYILEVNPLPGLNPDYSDLCIEATADGWRYEQLINRILDDAIERYQIKDAANHLPELFKTHPALGDI
jgi:D-alanine-D-alanine ligase